jgi:uncharacterized repeat protein (TIGR01451 family)
MKLVFLMLALIMPAAASAANEVTLSSQVFVERVKQDAEGKPRTVREKPEVVTPGDKLVFVLSYSNGGAQPAADFTLTNPIPQAVAYAAAEGAGSAVSVDGGKTWGQLAALKVALPDGTSRAALPADVTHVRWRLAQPIPAKSGGEVSFRGVVR